MDNKNQKKQPQIFSQENDYRWDLEKLRGLAQKVKDNEDAIERQGGKESSQNNEEIQCPR